MADEQDEKEPKQPITFKGLTLGDIINPDTLQAIGIPVAASFINDVLPALYQELQARWVMNVARSLPPEERRQLKEQLILDEPNLLTEREEEVASLLAKGLSQDEIANELIIETYTAKTHCYRIKEKWGMKGRVTRAKLQHEAIIRGYDKSQKR